MTYAEGVVVLIIILLMYRWGVHHGKTLYKAEVEVLKAELDNANLAIDILETKTQDTLGVGNGDGVSFVHGDYDSIKMCQKKLLEREELRRLPDLRWLELIPANPPEESVLLRNSKNQMLFSSNTSFHSSDFWKEDTWRYIPVSKLLSLPNLGLPPEVVGDKVKPFILEHMDDISEEDSHDEKKVLLDVYEKRYGVLPPFMSQEEKDKIVKAKFEEIYTSKYNP